MGRIRPIWTGLGPMGLEKVPFSTREALIRDVVVVGSCAFPFFPSTPLNLVAAATAVVVSGGGS